jgi:hypothetical protein
VRRVLCTIGLILVTCVFALMVNVTNYYVIGKTSPVTYQGNTLCNAMQWHRLTMLTYA